MTLILVSLEGAKSKNEINTITLKYLDFINHSSVLQFYERIVRKRKFSYFKIFELN